MFDRMPGEAATPIVIEAPALEASVISVIEEGSSGVLAAGPAISTPVLPAPVETTITEVSEKSPPPPVPADSEETEVVIRVEPPPPLPESEPQPEATVSWQGRLVPHSDVDVPPVATSRELPLYTRRAWRQRHEGVVRLDLLIDDKGYVSQLKVLEKIPHSDLHEVAMDAAVGWRFTPARKQGQEVKVWKTVAMEFSISPDHEEVGKVLE